LPSRFRRRFHSFCIHHLFPMAYAKMLRTNTPTKMVANIRNAEPEQEAERLLQNVADNPDTYRGTTKDGCEDSDTRLAPEESCRTTHTVALEMQERRASPRVQSSVHRAVPNLSGVSRRQSDYLTPPRERLHFVPSFLRRRSIPPPSVHPTGHAVGYFSSRDDAERQEAHGQNTPRADTKRAPKRIGYLRLRPADDR
jgi:hypothetical protein